MKSSLFIRTVGLVVLGCLPWPAEIQGPGIVSLTPSSSFNSAALAEQPVSSPDILHKRLRIGTMASDPSWLEKADLSQLTIKQFRVLRSLYLAHGKELFKEGLIDKHTEWPPAGGDAAMSSSYVRRHQGIILESGAMHCNWIVLFDRLTRTGTVLHVDYPPSIGFAQFMLDQALMTFCDACDKTWLKLHVIGLIIRAKEGLAPAIQILGDETERMYLAAMESIGLPYLPTLRDSDWVLRDNGLIFAVQKGIVLGFKPSTDGVARVSRLLELDSMIVERPDVGISLETQSFIRRDAPLAEQINQWRARGGRGRRIASVLLIDEQPLQNQFMKFLSFFFPHAVLVSHGPDDALPFLRSSPSDLIMLSRSIGSISGLDLIPAIRRLAPAAPVILMAAQLDQLAITKDLVEKVASDRNLFFLEKPFTVAEMKLLAGAFDIFPKKGPPQRGSRSRSLNSV